MLGDTLIHCSGALTQNVWYCFMVAIYEIINDKPIKLILCRRGWINRCLIMSHVGVQISFYGDAIYYIEVITWAYPSHRGN